MPKQIIKLVTKAERLGVDIRRNEDGAVVDIVVVVKLTLDDKTEQLDTLSLFDRLLPSDQNRAQNLIEAIDGFIAAEYA